MAVSSIHWLHVRGPFSSSGNESSEHTCSLPNPLLETPTDPVTGSLTFHALAVILSASAAAFAIVSIAILMARHATHLSRPAEQLKILRICMLIPVTATVQFVGQAAPQTYFFLTPWADVMQALALGNFFLLLLEFISPRGIDQVLQRDFFFSGLRVPAKRRGSEPRDGVRWYRRKWMAIFQYPIVQTLVSIGTDVTNAPSINVYCENSNKPYFARLWLNLAHTLSLLTAVVSCLRFYKILKNELAGHKPLAKLFAFKLMVGINLLMTIIFWILNGMDDSPLAPSNTLSEADVTVGIPALVNCLIMVPFSIFFHYAYDVGPYKMDKAAQHPEVGPGRAACPLQYHGGFMGIRAFAGMLDPREILSAIVFVFRMGGGKKKKMKMGGSGGFTARGYDTIDSVEGRDAGNYRYEMNGREQRTVDRYGGGQHSPLEGYGHQSGGAGRNDYVVRLNGESGGGYHGGYTR